MATDNKKIGQIVGTIVAIIGAAFLVQWGRFANATRKLTAGQATMLPANYFPFNGTFLRDEQGKIEKQA